MDIPNEYKPLFSIVIPVYKVDEAFLNQCVASILSQSFRNFELILIDDGSPDHCGQLCDSYSEKDSRIKVIHQKNQGVSVARNVGIQTATADWLWFIDGDDWIEPNALSILYDYLSENKEIDILQFRARTESESGSRLLDCGLQDTHIYDLYLPEVRANLYHRVMGVASDGHKHSTPAYYIWDKVFNRAFLLKNGLMYPPGIVKSEDKVFVSRCLQKAAKLRFVPNILYHYRQNEQSICHRYSANLSKNRIELVSVLLPIAKQMDADLANLLNEPTYHRISDDCERFMFGIITDVLLLQFYHNDNPNYRTRRKDALSFLNTEPFKSCIRNIPYSSLSIPAKIKKILLRHGFVSSFIAVNKLLKQK